MTAHVHRRRVGDLRTVLPVTLQQPDSTGTLAAINLTALTVTFKMINAATGATKIAATGTGVTVVTAASGTVNYDFSSGGVDASGVYWGTFLVTESGQTDAVPVRAKDLKIVIDSDTQTGEEAYAAAVAGQ
jgi:hypothetical protein